VPLLRTTWYTQLQRHTFSESWYRNASSPDPTIELAAARQYAVARAAIMGAPAQMYAIRISNVDDKTQRAYLAYVNYPGNFSVDGQGNYLHGSAASNVSLNMEFVNATNTQDKLLQLRAIWDDTEITGGVWNDQDPVYVPLIQAFGSKVVALGYGWRYNTGTTKVAIMNYAIDSNGLITFTVAAPFFTIPGTGSPVNLQARISGNVNSPNLNGQITLTPLTTTTARTIRPISAFPFVAGGFISHTTLAFTQAFNGRIQRLGKRQAGQPNLQSRGRGRNRIRG
jgi:hypothetical protein